MGHQVDDAGLISTPVVAVNAADGNLLVHQIDDAISKSADGTAVWSLDHWYNSSSSASRDLGSGWTTGLGYDVRLEFPANGQVRFVAPGGAAATFTQQSDGSYATSDPLGDDVDLTRTANGYDVGLGDEDRTLHFTAAGNLTSAADADGVVVRFDYTSANGQTRLSAAYNPAGQATRFSYNGQGQIIEADNPASQHGYYTYSGTRLSTATTPAGIKTTYTYYSNGQLKTLKSTGRSVAVTYDTSGRVTQLVDGGSVVSLAYVPVDASACADPSTASQTNITEPSGARLTYCFDSQGSVVSVVEPDTVAPTLDSPGFEAVYDTDSDRTLIDWTSASDPSLPSGSPGSGVSSYTIRISRDGGAWSDWQTVTYPQLLVGGGHDGQRIDVELQYSDAAGNAGTPVSGTTSATKFDSDDGDIACQPNDIGYSPDCVDDSANSADDDTEEDSDVGLADAASSSPNGASARALDGTCFARGNCRLKVSHNGWAIVRNRPQEYTIGNAHNGWNVTVHNSVQAENQTKGQPGVYAGLHIENSHLRKCGWIKTNALDSDGLGSAFDFSLCDPGFGTSFETGPGIDTFAAGVNCQNTATTHTCVDGYPVKTRFGTTRYRNVSPYPVQAITPSSQRRGLDAAGPIGAGRTVYWRYTTTDRNWAMVRYGKRTAGRTNWFFVRRSALNPICTHRSCKPRSEDG